MRKLMLASGLAAVGLFAVGCDAANSASKSAEKTAQGAAKGAQAAADKAKEAAASAGDAAKAAGDAAKDAVTKPVEGMYEKVETQIKGLSGDALEKAKAKFAEVKTLVEEFKKSPAEGMKAIQEKLTAAVTELKKLVNL